MFSMQHANHVFDATCTKFQGIEQHQNEVKNMKNIEELEEKKSEVILNC